MLLKIHGHVDRGATRELESFAVSEDDHIDYLAGVEAAGTVPVQIAARLRRSHLLFLGYAVDDWSLRVFLRRVWGHDRLAYRSWAVQSAAESLARELWRERGVEAYDVGLGRLLGAAGAGDGRARGAGRGRMNGGAPLPESPYKGLASFDDSELDERFFFGRDRETEIVASNLVASRLTVLYGPSGVGKSSLLRAGVVRRLRALVPAGGGAGDGNGALPVVVDQWRDDPLAAIADRSGGARAGSPEELADVLAERSAEVGGELYLVLDQMEEYFVYHGRDRGGPLREGARRDPDPADTARARAARHPRRRACGARRLQGPCAGPVRQRPPARPPGRRWPLARRSSSRSPSSRRWAARTWSLRPRSSRPSSTRSHRGASSGGSQAAASSKAAGGEAASRRRTSSS